MSRKPPPESSVPGEKLTRGSRRNQLRRGHGSPPVLSEVPHELSTDAHSKECKRSPQQFIPAGFPLHNQLPTGTEDSASPLTTPDMVRSGRVLQTSVKSPVCTIINIFLIELTYIGNDTEINLLRRTMIKKILCILPVITLLYMAPGTLFAAEGETSGAVQSAGEQIVAEPPG